MQVKFNVIKFFIIFGLVIISNHALAQSSTPNLGLSQAERDSILKDYDQLFPIWGRQAIEKGFDLPYPYGININYIYLNQGIDITNLGLSTGDNPTQTADFIKFDTGESIVSSVNSRFDLWVFPFLSVYGLFGQGVADTKVKLAEPVEFESGVSQKATYYGFGTTAAFGIYQNWLSFDINWAWADLELLKDPVQTRVMGIRFGRTVKLPNKHKMAFWVGTMNQKFETRTDGSVYLKDVLPGDFMDRLGDYQNQPWYQVLPPEQQQVVDDIVDNIQNNYDNAKINYGLDKGPTTPWNLIIGANYEISKSWQIRAEGGLIGRYSFFINLNYRFGG